MTVNINEYYGVTVFHPQKIGPKRWQVKAEIFRRDTFEVIEKFYTLGGAKTSAGSRAINEAEVKVASLSIQKGWKGKIG